MIMKALLIASALTFAGWPSSAAAKDPDEKLWAAVRKGNAGKVGRLLAGGVSAESRTVALSVAVSHDEPEAFRVLWNHDNSDISSDAILITVAETKVASANSFSTTPTRDGGATVSGFVFGTVTDRIEIVAIRTRPPG